MISFPSIPSLSPQCLKPTFHTDEKRSQKICVIRGTEPKTYSLLSKNQEPSMGFSTTEAAHYDYISDNDSNSKIKTTTVQNVSGQKLIIPSADSVQESINLKKHPSLDEIISFYHTSYGLLEEDILAGYGADTKIHQGKKIYTDLYSVPGLSKDQVRQMLNRNNFAESVFKKECKLSINWIWYNCCIYERNLMNSIKHQTCSAVTAHLAKIKSSGRSYSPLQWIELVKKTLDKDSHDKFSGLLVCWLDISEYVAFKSLDSDRNIASDVQNNKFSWRMLSLSDIQTAIDESDSLRNSSNDFGYNQLESKKRKSINRVDNDTSKSKQKKTKYIEQYIPADKKMSLSIDIDDQHPENEKEAARRNEEHGYLDGRLDRVNHGSLMIQGKDLNNIDSGINESVKEALKYLQSLGNFKDIKDEKGNVISGGFSEYSNTQKKHNPGLQVKSVARFSIPEYLDKLQQKPGFLRIFSVIKKLYPDLDILMVDLLSQNFRNGGNGATDFSWHQDTASLDNPENLDIKRTFILKLTEGESAMQIAGTSITKYDEASGSWVDFHAGAYHRSIVIGGTNHIKIVCFLGNKPGFDVSQRHPVARPGSGLKLSRSRKSVAIAIGTAKKLEAKSTSMPQPSKTVEESTNSTALPPKIEQLPVFPGGGDGERFTLHQNYTRKKIHYLSGDTAKFASWREGVRCVGRNFHLFVNLNKDIGSHLQYKDYFINPREFHWQSQIQTSHRTPVGQKLIHQKNSHYNINLFVRRQVKKCSTILPFMYLGKADYVRSSGDNPMNITWKLHDKIPPDIFEYLTERKL